MKLSVIIPVFNSERTVGAAIDSVLSQSIPPDEVLIMDDGSTDGTPSILRSYGSRVRVFRQENGGVASGRNFLLKQAQGNLIAFLDADDLWHPEYLAIQQKLFERYPDAVAFFTGHADFFGYGPFPWRRQRLDYTRGVEIIESVSFFKRYNQDPGPFASPSYLCVPRKVFSEMNMDPFPVRVSGADDFFLCNYLPLIGPVVYAPEIAVAYRITEEAQSANLVKSLSLSVQAFELLKEHYSHFGNTQLADLLSQYLASRRRQYGKRLMGAGEIGEARTQFRYSMNDSDNLLSVTKSAVLLFFSTITVLQPLWPSGQREWEEQ